MSNRPNTKSSASVSKTSKNQKVLDDNLSLYLHFPFCSKICGYCDFHKELFDRRKEALYFQALAVDTALAAEEVSATNDKPGKKPLIKKKLESLYIGGGTPSLASPELFSAWIAQLRELFEFADDLEFTVEVNPESANQNNLEQLAQNGVNRLSVGVQSFDAESLRALDRRHKVQDTLRVFYLARALGIENISADLIFGLPNQDLNHLNREVTELLELDPTHISFYQLTVKENTPLAAQVQSGEIILPNNDNMALLYRAGSEFFAEQGFSRYEVSSFAKEGAKSKHNTRYWSNKPYIALGPGAHGYTGEHRYALVSNTEAYVSALLDDSKRPLVWDRLTKADRMLEDIMLALRTSDGLDVKRFANRHGKSPQEVFNTKEYKRLITSEKLLTENGHLRLSNTALALADEIIARLVA